MNHSDFYIGLEFVGAGGIRYRCTDVGTRTILAIQLNHRSPAWYQGPPYITEEIVFDEVEIGLCHLTIEDAISVAALNNETSRHPGYPADVVKRMMKARRAHRYPHEGVLRFDRRRDDGEILHPYAGHKQRGTWMVDLYLPFLEAYVAMAEDDFIALPMATAQDIRSRADRANQSEAVRRLEQLGGSDPDANVPSRRRGRPR